MSYNPGLLYYRHYYEDIVFSAGPKNTKLEDANRKVFERHNRRLTDTRFSPQLLPALQGADVHHFALTTTYPGLLIGTGYTHGSGQLGEFKTGFYFDHTTGLPVIPGSSVKGLLRSAFPGLYREKAGECKSDPEEARFWNKLAANREKFLRALLKALDYDADGSTDIRQLEGEIFEGLLPGRENREKDEHHFPMRHRDIFFDAVVSGSRDGLIFADDYITPHRNPLKNPVPIQLLKVRPGVAFTFQFRLPEAYELPAGKQTERRSRLLTPGQRLNLFRQILLFLGAGAKTNTGYGHFEAAERVDLGGGTARPAEERATAAPPAQTPAAREPAARLQAFDKKLVNKEVRGELVRVDGQTAFFRLPEVSGFEGEVSTRHALVSRFAVGKHYLLRVTRADPARSILEVTIHSFQALD